MQRPCTHPDGSPDHRYAIRQEYCGDINPRWVARFCSEWLGAFTTSDAAAAHCRTHRLNRA